MLTASQCLVALVYALGHCSPAAGRLVKRATLPPKWTVKLIGNSTSNFPNIYRDGGGGGKIGKLNFVNFADGTTTTGGYPLADGSNFKAFGSNSIVLTGSNGGGPQSFFDFGSNGVPKQQVPTFAGEENYGIWPNVNIATLCNGNCGVAFYPVVDRTTTPCCGFVYGTAVNITPGFAPVVDRPVKALFSKNEVQFGMFSSFPGIDGWLYMFGSITGTQNANGLKMARAPQSNPFDRSGYQYWNGKAWGTTVTPYDDGGKANIFNYSTTILDGSKNGPASGDLFFSGFYGVYMLLFQAVGIDPNIYMSYSSKLESGWSKPVSVYQTPTINSFNYAIHAYPHYDETQKVVPVSFTQQGIYTNPKGGGTYIAWANITFS